MTKENKQLGAFTYHGVELKSNNRSDNLIADCPFCGREDHFFVSPETTKWDCKKMCGEGNAYTFLQEWWKSCKEDTKDSQYKELSVYQGIPVDALRKHLVSYDDYNERWIIPVINENNTTLNIRVWNLTGKPDPITKQRIRKLHNTKGMNSGLFNLQNLQPDGPIYICEGEWDAIILDSLADQTKEDDEPPTNILACPGTKFSDNWIQHVKGRNVYILFDHDKTGEKGRDSLQKKISSHVNSLQILRWPTEYPEGYDVRDFIIKGKKDKKDPVDIWNELHELFEEKAVEGEEVEEKRPVKLITSFSTVTKKYKKYIYMTPNMEEALAVMFATCFATRIPGVLAWMFIVGPSGSGKTILLKSMGTADDCLFISTMTPHSLVSGWKENKNRGEEDPSLLKKFDGKTVIYKDWTEILNLPQTVQEEIYGVFRGAHDKRIDKYFGNGVHRNWPVRFGLLAGVTAVIYKDNRADVGERFLKFRLLGKKHSNREHIMRAIENEDNAAKIIDYEKELEDTAAGFLSRKIDLDNLPTVSHSMKVRICAIAEIVACLRTKIDRQQSGGLSYRPEVETASRLAEQLIKIGKCLCFVYTKKTMDNIIYSIVERIALDTGFGWTQDILKVLINSKKPIDREKLGILADMSYSGLSRRLENLQELKYEDEPILIKTKNPDGTVGQPKTLYSVSKFFKKLWKEAKIGKK